MPFPDPQRLATVFEKRPHENIFRGSVSALDFLDWRRMAHSFSAMGLYDTLQLSVTGNGDPVRLRGARVSAGLFEAVGVPPNSAERFACKKRRPGDITPSSSHMPSGRRAFDTEDPFGSAPALQPHSGGGFRSVGA